MREVVKTFCFLRFGVREVVKTFCFLRFGPFWFDVTFCFEVSCVGRQKKIINYGTNCFISNRSTFYVSSAFRHRS